MEATTQTVTSILSDLERAGAALPRAPLPTGFEPLDHALLGGIRPQDLTLIGGKPGVGKTMAAMQWAREMALDGAHVVFTSYEHSAQLLTGRLLLTELASLVRSEHVPHLEQFRAGVAEFADGRRAIEDLDDERGLLGDALASIRAYSDHLWIIGASGRDTGLPELARLVDQHGAGRTALFVDYLHKVPADPPASSEDERVIRVADGLKDLAMSQECAVVAVAASGAEGLTSHRQRVHHLRGSSALAYEADTVIMLNEKLDAVSSVHLQYDLVRAESFRDLVVFSIEKNRNGRAGIDIEFEKDFAHARFVPRGQRVADALVDERIVTK